MADGTDQAADAFRADMNPGTAQPRNDRGQFDKIAPPVERLFEARKFEESDESPDDEPRYESEEKPDGRKDVPADEQEPSGDEEPDEGGESEGEEGDPDGDPEQDTESESGPEYEVNVDGAVKKVSLKEALEGYIRTETFHQRMNKVSEVTKLITEENNKNVQLRDYWLKKAQALEGEYNALIPKEPNWDEEFARNPAEAHALQKQFQAVKGRLDAHRAEVAKEQAALQAENAARVKQFADMGRAKFVEDNQLQDPKVLDREIQSMRKTALSAGFTEQEVAEVYDPRMLNVLRKASKYDRMMMAKPKAVIPGKGKTLTPGSVNGAKGRSDRKGIDAAQRNLAASGRVDDMAEFFRKFL